MNDDPRVAKMIELRKRGVPIKHIASQFRLTVSRVSEILLAHGLEKGTRSHASKW